MFLDFVPLEGIKSSRVKSTLEIQIEHFAWRAQLGKRNGLGWAGQSTWRDSGRESR